MMTSLADLARRRMAVLAMASLVALMLTSARAGAHDEGVLKLAKRELSAGDTISVGGEKFTRRSELTLVLAGVRGRLELGKVRTDSAGAFSAQLVLPADAAEGAYRLVALAADGDEVATLDVTLAARASAEEHGPSGMHETAQSMHEPSAEPLALERARSVAVTAGTIAFAALALALGVVLLRRPNGAA